MGDFPWMTEAGTFVINYRKAWLSPAGAPGAYFEGSGPHLR